MIAADKNALICDLAETYTIHDMYMYSAFFIATLSAGLRADSRIMLKLSGMKISTEMMLLTAILDNLNILIWSKTKDAEKGRNKPKSLFTELSKSADDDNTAFSGIEEFEKARKKILERSG